MIIHDLKSNLFLKNIVLAIVIFFAIVLFVFLFLRIYTNHGEAFSVPDFKGMRLEQAKTLANEMHLRLIVSDSSFQIDSPPETVLEQHPVAGFKVKKNRKIFITKNAHIPDNVLMPNVVGLTLRQARSQLESSGLVVGDIKYTPDIAVGEVLKQQYRGKTVDASDSIIVYKGSFIDLVVGRGLSHQSAYIPDVVGLSVEKAKEKINDAVLNLGAIIEDNTIVPDQDSIEVFIYKQRPVKDIDRRIPLGSAIDVWITTDSTKLPFYIPIADSTEIEFVKEDI